MSNKIEMTNKIASMVNEIRPISGAKLWTAKDEEGNVVKARVYFNADKGYVEVRDNNQVYFETVGRSSFEAVKTVVANLNLKRVYA